MNYIQALEKAVKEKFGEETTLNPKQLWNEEKEKEFVAQQKEFLKKTSNSDKTREKVEVDGVLLPKKLLNKSVNRVCSSCNKYSFNKKDDIYMIKYNACYRCFMCKPEDKIDG